MPILTKTRLTEITENKLGMRVFNESLSEARAATKSTASTSVFLSHSHEDRLLVNKVAVLLRKNGYNVYVDWLDSTMPVTTNAETATKLKQRIISCKKFVFIATNDAILSRWCNWELGFGDAQKYLNNIALFPIAENYGSWNGSEYLNIYPRIEESNYTSEYYKVIFPSSQEMSIQEWLNLQ